MDIDSIMAVFQANKHHVNTFRLVQGRKKKGSQEIKWSSR